MFGKSAETIVPTGESESNGAVVDGLPEINFLGPGTKLKTWHRIRWEDWGAAPAMRGVYWLLPGPVTQSNTS